MGRISDLVKASCFLCAVIGAARLARAQTPPEIAYIFPPGGAPGTTVDVVLGGFNWTPDMQLFVHDPRVKLELVGKPGPVIVPYPPYWFGRKARDNDPPLPREFPARLTIPADVPPGLIRWQAANANGASAAGVLLIAAGAEVREVGGHQSTAAHKQPQQVASLPTAIVGQLSRLEEIDRYQFTASRNGPISLDVWTRRLKTKMNAVLEVRDSQGKLIADGADTAGNDLQLTFAARQGERYTVSLYDVDFRGYTSYVYRLVIHDGPRVTAAVPAVGKRGESRPVEFLGYGIATGAPRLESVVHTVGFPTDPNLATWSYPLETPFGKALPIEFGLSDLPQMVELGIDPNQPGAPRRLTLPVSLTGVMESPFGEERYLLEGKQGETWTISARSRGEGEPLDLSVAIYEVPAAGGSGPKEPKELQRVDDAPGSLDPFMQFKLPSDGQYQLVISDASRRSGAKDAVYTLQVEQARPDFSFQAPEFLSVLSGGKASLPLKVTRLSGLGEPIAVELVGLPSGVAAPANLVIEGTKSELAIELTCAADAAVTAGLVTIKGSCTTPAEAIVRQSTPTLVAMTMKPRAKLVPEGLDDVRKWPRGSTFPSPVFVERLEGFAGPVRLEQTAHQQRSRQGMTGPELEVPPGVGKIEYPIFVPEWMETTKTSRMIINAVVQVPDPKGNVRHLLNKMELRMGVLPVGAMLKISHHPTEIRPSKEGPINVTIQLTRTPELTEEAVLELVVPEELEGKLTAERLTIAAAQHEVEFKIKPAGSGGITGEHQLKIRATVMHQGKLPTVAETSFFVDFGN